MAEDLFILLKPSIHGAPLNGDEPGEVSLEITCYGRISFAIADYDVVEMVLRGLRCLGEVLVREVASVEEIPWVIWLCPAAGKR